MLKAFKSISLVFRTTIRAARRAPCPDQKSTTKGTVVLARENAIKSTVPDAKNAKAKGHFFTSCYRNVSHDSNCNTKVVPRG